MNSNMRKAGILMPVASLPGRHGGGTFGKEAYDFVKMMHQSGLGIWQLLPLNPLGYGNSPYQPYSSYAVDELYISLDVLAQQGLLEKVPSYHRNDDAIQYEKVRQYHDKYLRLAYQKFEKDEAYESFIKKPWVKEYAIFKTFKVANNLRPWNEWEKELKDYPINQKLDLSKYDDEIAYQMFLQFVLYQQWHALKKYANSLGIHLFAANHLEINNGRLTGRLIGQVITREVKEEIFLQWASELEISLDRTIAIGDGANDLKMLKKAGIGVAFCAKDILKKEIKLHIDERDLVKVLDLIDFL